MLAKIWGFIKATWRSLSAIGTVIGVLYLWPDIQGLPVQYGFSWKWLISLDREVIAYILLGLSLVWVFWIDARPFVRRWLDRRRSPFGVIYANEINDPAKYGVNKITRMLIPDGFDRPAVIHETIYRLGVKNTLEQKSITNVHVVLHQVSKPTAFFDIHLNRSDTDVQHSVNIPPQRVIYFDLGRSFHGDKAADVIARIGRQDYETRERLRQHIGFVIGTDPKKNATLLKNNGYELILGIYGDDVRAQFVKFRIDAKDEARVYYSGIIPGEELGFSPQ